MTRWRFTLLALAIAVALPFEVYLTALSLRFLDVNVTGQRVVTVGVALCVALSGLLSAHVEVPYVDRTWIRGRQVEPRPLDRAILRGFAQVGIQNALQAGAFLLAAILIVGLAVLRYGVFGLATWWEKTGAMIVLAVVAAVFALWVAFVHQQLQHAQALQRNWQRAEEWRFQLAAARDQVGRMEERLAGLPAELKHHEAEALAVIDGIPDRFDTFVGNWWAGYQSTNRGAAPDIRPEQEELKRRLLAKTQLRRNEIESRVRTLRECFGGGCGENKAEPPAVPEELLATGTDP